MSKRIDEAAGIRAIKECLYSQHYVERDADGSDFQFGSDTSLRFKVGMVYGEVTVTVWQEGKQTQAIRILSDAQVVEAKHHLDAIITAHRERMSA